MPYNSTLTTTEITQYLDEMISHCGKIYQHNMLDSSRSCYLVETLTSGGIKNEGDPYPLLFTTPKYAWDAFIFQLATLAKQRKASSFGWRVMPELKEYDGAFVVRARLHFGKEYFK